MIRVTVWNEFRHEKTDEHVAAIYPDGIHKTIQWYLDNREWWETIISGEYQNYYEKMYSNR